MSQTTKRALEASLKHLLAKKPLDKITINDIAEDCGISRMAFYYHFKDKYELINWIFYDDMIRNVNSFDDPSKLTDSFVNVCKCLYKEREFYFACFQYVGQNSLFETLQELYYELWKMNLETRYVQLSEEELDLMAKLNAYALVGIITDWVKKGMHNNYMSYFERVRSLLDMEYFTISKKEEKTSEDAHRSIAS